MTELLGTMQLDAARNRTSRDVAVIDEVFVIHHAMYRHGQTTPSALPARPKGVEWRFAGAQYVPRLNFSVEPGSFSFLS